MIRQLFLTFALLFAATHSIWSQPKNTDIRFEDYTYVDYIKSVQLLGNGQVLKSPIVAMNEKIVLTFDDMNADDYEYQYTIIHCDKTWQPSNLFKQDYIDGFEADEIDNRAVSEFSKTDYTTHTLILPNAEMRWKLSGNYLLIVYDDEDQPVITRRLVIHENIGIITATIDAALTANKIRTHQRVEFDFKNFPTTIQNPREFVTASIFQNAEWSTLQSAIAPDNAVNDAIYFGKYNRIEIPSRINYRWFDTRTLESRTRFVKHIEFNLDTIEVLLDLEHTRPYGTYAQLTDKNGRFVLENKDYNQFNHSAQYTEVIFSLADLPYRPDQEVYIVGAFSDYQPYEEYRLDYLKDRDIYIGKAPFRQGHYDYHFAIWRDGKWDYSLTEMNDREATHDYTIIIYYSDPILDYDRVLNFKRHSN